jgi:hypothetical protein
MSLKLPLQGAQVTWDDLLLKWVDDNCDALDPYAAFIKLDMA